MTKLYFDTWESLLRPIAVGVPAYIALVLSLRISGKRTLSKMNAFDLIVTVSLGSTLATVLLSKDVALAEGVLAFGLLIGLQFAVTWTSVRSPWVRKLVTGEPSMLAYRGAFLPDAMKRSRVTEDEIRAAVRAAGVDDFTGVEAVVLETDGSFSVVRPGGGEGHSTLVGVGGPRRDAQPQD